MIPIVMYKWTPLPDPVGYPAWGMLTGGEPSWWYFALVMVGMVLILVTAFTGVYLHRERS